MNSERISHPKHISATMKVQAPGALSHSTFLFVVTGWEALRVGDRVLRFGEKPSCAIGEDAIIAPCFEGRRPAWQAFTCHGILAGNAEGASLLSGQIGATSQMQKLRVFKQASRNCSI